MNKKRNYIIIFSLLIVLTIGAISIDYVKQLGSIMAQGETPNPGHALNEIAEWETLVKTSGDQTIAGVKTFSSQVVASNGIKIGSSALNCNTDNAGVIKYDSGFYGCDGSEWKNLITSSFPQFCSSPEFVCGEPCFDMRNGVSYETVVNYNSGECHFGEPLKYCGKFNDDFSDGYGCKYDNEGYAVAQIGAMGGDYDFFEVLDEGGVVTSERIQGLCPDGWYWLGRASDLDNNYSGLAWGWPYQRCRVGEYIQGKACNDLIGYSSPIGCYDESGEYLSWGCMNTIAYQDDESSFYRENYLEVYANEENNSDSMISIILPWSEMPTLYYGRYMWCQKY